MEKGGRRESWGDETVEGRHREGSLLALKMTKRQGMWAASRGGKGQEMDSSRERPERNAALPVPSF